MGKYDPLARYLKNAAAPAILLTFEEVEAILGFPLPPSQSDRAWWSNNASNNVMTKAWLSAGYETEKVDLAKKTLVFRRLAQSDGKASNEDSEETVVCRHPAYGWMAGMSMIAAGTDLTQPADPEWGNVAWGRQDPTTSRDAANKEIKSS